MSEECESEWSGGCCGCGCGVVVKKAVGRGERERESVCVVCVRWLVLKLLACCLSASGMALPLWATPHQASCSFGATSHAMVVLERETHTHCDRKREMRDRRNPSFRLFSPHLNLYFQATMVLEKKMHACVHGYGCSSKLHSSRGSWRVLSCRLGE